MTKRRPTKDSQEKRLAEDFLDTFVGTGSSPVFDETQLDRFLSGFNIRVH